MWLFRIGWLGMLLKMFVCFWMWRKSFVSFICLLWDKGLLRGFFVKVVICCVLMLNISVFYYFYGWS